MGITSRTHTYLIKNRLIPITNHRSNDSSKWPKIKTANDSDLVAIISGGNGNLDIERGPQATTELLAQSVIIHLDSKPDKINDKLWGKIPKVIIKNITNLVEKAGTTMSQLLPQISNEEYATGTLFGQINSTITTKNWKASFNFIEFSKLTKEPKTGADIALVIDVLNKNGERCFKSIWFQAKISPQIPSDWRKLPRLKNQMEEMRKFTPESFGLIYTNSGPYLVGDSRVENKKLGDAISDAMQCRIGDKTTPTLAQSMNRKNIFQIFITQTS